MFKRLGLIAALAAFAGACANMVQVKIDVVDQRTALERQVLGTYQQLDGDLTLLASVRSLDAQGRLKPAPELPEGRRLAVRALQRSRFNQDDIERLKAGQIIGENNQGYLTYFETGATRDDPKQAAFAQEMVSQENSDRLILYRRVMEVTEGFGEGDLPKVEKIMAGLMADSARPGDLAQDAAGRWRRKEAR